MIKNEGRSYIFINRFFYPDHSATSQMLTDLAFHLASQNLNVLVISSRQVYDDPLKMLPEYQQINGVVIYRLRTTRFGRRTLIGKVIDFLSFYILMFRELRRQGRAGDIVVVKTDPPLASVVAMLACRDAVIQVTWLQDLYPEVAAALGISVLKGALGKGLMRLRDRSLRRAKMNIAISEGMRSRLMKRGIPEAIIDVIPNWADDSAIHPMPHASNPARQSWGLVDKFIICYSGNLGRAHEADTILSAAEALIRRDDIFFLFIGGGNGFSKLEKDAAVKNIRNFKFKPYQPRDNLINTLGVADLHLVSLLPTVEGLIMPSKLYGIAAAGRPIIAITATDGEIAGLLKEHDCGVTIMPGDGQRLAEVISSLAGDPAQCALYGANARRMLEGKFLQSTSLNRWYNLLTSLPRDNQR